MAALAEGKPLDRVVTLATLMGRRKGMLFPPTPDTFELCTITVDGVDVSVDVSRVLEHLRAPGDLDIAVVGQLPPSQLPFDRKLEPGPLEMEGFEATLRCRRLIEQMLKDAPSHAHGALVLAQQHRELDRIPVAVPPGVLGEGEEDHCRLQQCSLIVP